MTFIEYIFISNTQEVFTKTDNTLLSNLWVTEDIKKGKNILNWMKMKAQHVEICEMQLKQSLEKKNRALNAYIWKSGKTKNK